MGESFLPQTPASLLHLFGSDCVLCPFLNQSVTIIGEITGVDSFRQVVLKLRQATDSFEGSVEMQIIDSTPRVCDSAGLRWDLRVSSKFLGDADVAGQRTTF